MNDKSQNNESQNEEPQNEEKNIPIANVGIEIEIGTNEHEHGTHGTNEHETNELKETTLIIKTSDERLVQEDEIVCSICFYNSCEEDNDEQEKKVIKKTIYDSKRYGQLFTLSGDEHFEPVCSHRFHTTCLYQWIKSSREFKCPMCRATVNTVTKHLTTVPEIFGSEPEYIVQYYANGKMQMECYKEKGVLDKFLKKYDLLGNPTYECGYFKGEKHGDEIEYHIHTSKRWKLQQYRHGSKHGDFFEYSLNDSEIIKHQQFRNGMLHGSDAEWFIATKSKKHECFYHEGLKHGIEKIWTITGKLIFYKNHVHGRPIGRCIVRFPDNGCLERKCYYNSHGQPDGLYLEWQYACKSLTKSTNSMNSNSITSNSINSNSNSMNSSNQGFSLLGMLTGGGLNMNVNNAKEPVINSDRTDVVLKIRSFYVDGALVGPYREYHDNGQLMIQSLYNSNSQLDEEYFEYDRFGRCVLRYLYDNGKLHGVCERYFENGKIKEYGIYVNDQLHGIDCYRQYYQNGKIKVRQSYNQGVLHGESIYYNPKGAVVTKHNYNNGISYE